MVIGKKDVTTNMDGRNQTFWDRGAGSDMALETKSAKKNKDNLFEHDNLPEMKKCVKTNKALQN